LNLELLGNGAAGVWVQLEKNGTSCRSLIALLYYFIQASDALFAGVEVARVVVNS
jgi:hypothetical protein